MSSSENEFKVSEEESEVGDEEQGDSEASDDEQQDIIKQQSEEQSEESEDEEQEEEGEEKKIESKISFADKRQYDESEESENEQRKNQDQKKKWKPKIPFNTTKKNFKEICEERKGKTLFLAFPNKVPTDVKVICDRIIKVHRPRTPSARHCFVDFQSSEDRQIALNQLEKVEIDGRKLIVRIPRSDSEDFYEKKQKLYSSTLVVRNIPSSATAAEIITHFPKAVEFKLIPPETVTAIVTLPTPEDAKNAKVSNIRIGKNFLQMIFARNNTVAREMTSPTKRPIYPKRERRKTDVDGSHRTRIEQNIKNKLKRELKSEPDERHEEVEKHQGKKFKHNSGNSHTNKEMLIERPSTKCEEINFNKPNQLSDEKNGGKFDKQLQNNSNFNKAAYNGNFNKRRNFGNKFKGGRKPFNKN